MNAYDIQLALMRRRLLLTLRHQKAYMDSLYIEYTGETFETNVRPSLPFKMDGAVETAIDVNIKNAKDCLSMPTSLEVDITNLPDFSICKNMGNALPYKFQAGDIDITAYGETPFKVGFLDPTPVETYNIRANVDMCGKVGELELKPIGAYNIVLPSTLDASFALGELELQKAYLNDAHASVKFEGKLTELTLLGIPDTAIHGTAEYKLLSDIDAATVKELRSETNIKAAGIEGIAVHEYYKLTLNKIGTETLNTLSDMPINARYIDNCSSTPFFAV